MFDQVKQDIENNMPKCTTWLHYVGVGNLAFGIFVALLIFVGFAYINDDFILLGLIIAGIVGVSFGVYSLLLEALSEIVSNTYRSAEYAKYQTEMLSKRLNISEDVKTAHENLSEDLPEM